MWFRLRHRASALSRAALCVYVLVISLNASSAVTALSNNQTAGLGQNNTAIEPRSCPGCLGGSCDAHTSISGLPIVQLIAATAVGFIWAAVFIWLYANFYEGGGSGGGYGGGGYGYASPAPQPQYGGYAAPAPKPQYGGYAAPAPVSTYNAPVSTYKAPSRSSYYNGRSLYDSVADNVFEALRTAIRTYDQYSSVKQE